MSACLLHLVLCGAPCFALGVYVGWFTESQKGHIVTHSQTLRAWFDRWMAVLYLGVAALALVGIVIATTATLTNARQDAQAQAENKTRDAETSHLLDCFDQFATALAGSLPPVRAASAARDDATAVRDHAFQRLIVILADASAAAAAGTPEDEDATSKAFGTALVKLVKAGDKLDRAQAALDKARKENRYPPAPSTFCDVA